jgi:hypothetical protein
VARFDIQRQHRQRNGQRLQPLAFKRRGETSSDRVRTREAQSISIEGE